MSRLIGCVVSFLICRTVLAVPAVEIVKDGRAACVVVIADNAGKQVRGAADLLVDMVAESTGAKLPIVTRSKVGSAVNRIHIGPTGLVPTTSTHLDGLDDDGFVILPVDGKGNGRDLIIIGPTDWGTEFGVCEFLETCVGVRWLMPGKHGTHVPKKSSIVGPSELVRQSPAAFSRLFSGLPNATQLTWARRNRMRGRVKFHHHLLHLFPPETYAKTNPEFFPVRKGERYLPDSNKRHGWQPCFSAPGIVKEAVKNIKAHFAAHPDETSYSLGVTDSGGHCECEECRAKDSGKRNFIGIRCISDRYFEWCNAVVTEVLDEYPDKWFGCLAYRHVIEPPKRVKVHPRIIPFITYDRMKWARAEQREQGHRMTEWWRKTCPTIGWYDYIYGTPYLLPRVYFHEMAKYYRFGSRHGVRVHYAEAYPNWGEGPKLYVSLKLQWNPDRDIDALLKDWYTACVGAKAAKSLADYYALWEEFWTGPALRSGWYRSKGEYLAFSSPAYLSAVTPTMIKRSRELLEDAVGKAATPDQKARAKLIFRAFEYYEASAYGYLFGQNAQADPVEGEQDALDRLAQVRGGINMALKRRHVLASLEKDPVLRHPLPPSRYGLLGSDSWGLGEFWSLYPWLDQSRAFRRRIVELAESQDPGLAGPAKAMLAIRSRKLTPVSVNPGFELGHGEVADGWSYWVSSTGKLRRTKEAKRSGKWGLVAEDFARGGPNQSVDVTPGRYVAMCHVYVPKGQKTNGSVSLSIIMRDAKDNNLDGSQSLVTPAPGRWTLIAVQLDVTAKSRGKAVPKVLFCPIIDGFKQGQQIYLDDCRLYRMAE